MLVEGQVDFNALWCIEKFLDTFLLRLIDTNISILNVNCLYQMLEDYIKSRFTKIELDHYATFVTRWEEMDN